MHDLFVYTFYRFKDLKKISNTKIIFDEFLNKTRIKGTILIAHEGINCSLSGSKSELNFFIKFLKTNLRLRKLDIKINKVDYLPFNYMIIQIITKSFNKSYIFSVKIINSM